MTETIFWRAAKVTAGLVVILAVAFGDASVAHAATFTVTNTNDSGAGSLRQAITEANNSPGADTINFNISGSGVKTISPSSELPAITDPVTIDGYTQPGAKANTRAVGNDAALKIQLNGENAGNVVNGLTFSGTANGSVVSGLVVNRFGLAGINLDDVFGIRVVGNFVGTDATGTVALGNGFGSTGHPGVYVHGRQNEVGDFAPAARNLISGNYEGVGIESAGSATSTPDQNIVKGNYIGTDRSGTAKLGNAFAGVVVRGPLYNHVAENVISGNGGNGVEAHAAHTIANGGGTQVWGNLIGLKSDGIEALGNSGDGVLLTSRFNRVGDVDVPNTIAFNGDDGVGIELIGPSDWPTGENHVSGNSIFSNGGLGIDLGGDGVTANDPGDADTGANTLQNFPVLSSARSSATYTAIRGTLNSAPNTTYTVQFFSGPVADPSGNGEGKTYRGQKTDVKTDPSGKAGFTFTTSVRVPVGHVVSATATSGAPDTSEFSNAVGVVDATAPTVMRVAPADGATGVAPAANVTATFSEPMRANTINKTTIRLRKAGTTSNVAATVTYDATNKRAVLNPSAKLATNTRYIASVTSGAKDLAGNALDQDASLSGDQPKVWKFTVQ